MKKIGLVTLAMVLTLITSLTFTLMSRERNIVAYTQYSNISNSYNSDIVHASLDDVRAPSLEVEDFVPEIATRSNATVVQRTWALDRINAPTAWNITHGNEDIIVGVLDTGIQATHPSLRNLIHPDPNIHYCL